MTNPHGRPGVLPVALAGWRTDSSRLWERDPLERDVRAHDEAPAGRETSKGRRQQPGDPSIR